MSIEYSKHCRGCSSAEGTGVGCDSNPYYEGFECPCLTCLVKTMCIYDYVDCDLFQDFVLKEKKLLLKKVRESKDE